MTAEGSISKEDFINSCIRLVTKIKQHMYAEEPRLDLENWHVGVATNELDCKIKLMNHCKEMNIDFGDEENPNLPSFNKWNARSSIVLGVEQYFRKNRTPMYHEFGDKGSHNYVIYAFKHDRGKVTFSFKKRSKILG